MSLLAIEIADAGVVARPGAAPPSPGVALIDGHRVLTGVEAAANARLTPRKIHDRFWTDLDTAPLSRPFPSDLSRADLAHEHLSSAWQPMRAGVDAVLLALSGAFSETQLGLVLGIARSCDMPVTGMVDAALAAAVTVPSSPRSVVVDVERHRAVVTEIACAGDIARGEVRVGEAVGLSSIHDGWAKWIAGRFVRETRFDPLHVGPTEQELYRRLPSLLDSMRDADRAAMELEGGGRRHTVELAGADLRAAADGAYATLAELVRPSRRAGEPLAVLLTARASGLPGLADRLAADLGGVEVHALGVAAACDGALRYAPAIGVGGHAVPFVTRLPHGATEPAIPVSSSPSRATTEVDPGVPTHVLYRDRAHRVGSDPLVVGTVAADGARSIVLTGDTAGVSRSHCRVARREGRVVLEDHSTYGTFLNGQRVAGATELGIGDRVRVGTPGIELRIIREVEDGGAT